MNIGSKMIADERTRQIEQEGYDEQHDQRYLSGELPIAAACYAVEGNEGVFVSNGMGEDEDAWPWGTDFDKRKKHNRLKRLVIAGALIAAEIDRILAEKIKDENDG